MSKKINSVQNYVNELNKIDVPSDEKSILKFLSSLEGEQQKNYLSFILSQSHIFDNMIEILNSYAHIDFYHNAGYFAKGKKGNIVPKVSDKGEIYYEEYTSGDIIDKNCRTILKSLQSGDKLTWGDFVKYINSIYEPDQIDIYASSLKEFYMNLCFDFKDLIDQIVENRVLKSEIDESKNKPVEQKKGIIGKVSVFFDRKKREWNLKKKESKVQSDSELSKKALEVIQKYKKDDNTSTIIKKYFEFAEQLISVGLPSEILSEILQGLSISDTSSASCNRCIFNMLKQLQLNATIGKELYSSEILYADSFQNMTQNIRKLLSKNELEEIAPITTEYRNMPLKNGLLPTEDISKILKGKNLSKQEIQDQMAKYDKEFEEILKEDNPEIYVRRCTDLMMSFISTHPFDDGNGRTSRMLLQVMLARRGIMFPSNIDNYFERQSNTEYSMMEENCLITDDYTKMEEYILERAKKFNNGELVLDDEPLIFEEKSNQKVVEQDIIYGNF